MFKILILLITMGMAQTTSAQLTTSDLAPEKDRAPASGPAEGAVFEVRGESRNLDMMLTVGDGEEIDFIKLRESYAPEVQKRYEKPNY